MSPINRGMMTSSTAEWATPQAFFDKLNSEFHFALDVCSTDDNAKCSAHYTKEQNGLKQPWVGSCWMNPPYGRRIGAWMRKAYESSQAGALVVCLLPARTDARWFHRWVLGKAELRFVAGRLHFVGAKSGAPFPSMVAIYRPPAKER